MAEQAAGEAAPPGQGGMLRTGSNLKYAPAVYRPSASALEPGSADAEITRNLHRTLQARQPNHGIMKNFRERS
jgi:hypothetical protein